MVKLKVVDGTTQDGLVTTGLKDQVIKRKTFSYPIEQHKDYSGIKVPISLAENVAPIGPQAVKTVAAVQAQQSSSAAASGTAAPGAAVSAVANPVVVSAAVQQVNSGGSSAIKTLANPSVIKTAFQNLSSGNNKLQNVFAASADGAPKGNSDAALGYLIIVGVAFVFLKIFRIF